MIAVNACNRMFAYSKHMMNCLPLSLQYLQLWKPVSRKPHFSYLQDALEQPGKDMQGDKEFVSINLKPLDKCNLRLESTFLKALGFATPRI